MNHFINTAVTDLSLARSVSLVNPTTPKPFPVIAYGDEITHQFFFHSNGAIESWSGDASNGLRVTLGDVNSGPSGGTYFLTCGTNTPALLYGATADDIESALNALAQIITNGGVDVFGAFPNFIIAWRAAGAVTAITASAVNLVPDSGIALTMMTTGDATHAQRVALTLRQNAINSTTTWTPITTPYAGWSGTLTTNTAAGLAMLLERGEQIGSYVQAQTIITVERIRPDGAYETLYQAAVIIRAKNADLGASAGTAFPRIASPLTLYAKNLTISAGVPAADIATIAIPAGIPRWAVYCTSNSDFHFLIGGAMIRESGGDMSDGSFSLYTGAGGTGTLIGGPGNNPNGPASGLIGRFEQNEPIQMFTASTIYLRYDGAAAHAGVASAYVMIFPLL